MAFLSALGAIGSSLLGGIFGSKAAKTGAQQSAQGQAEANQTNIAINNATNAANAANVNNTNAANLQSMREYNATATANANSAQAFNAQQAQTQRDYQTQMSNTAHQREVTDLKKAGLNPILSGMGGSGSSTPSGAQASAVVPNIQPFRAESPHASATTVANAKAEFANSGRALASLYGQTAANVADVVRKYPLMDPSIINAHLQNDLLTQQIKQVEQSNARQGMLTPVYDAAGKIVKFVTGQGEKLAGDAVNAVQTVKSRGGAADAGNDIPTSAKNLGKSVIPDNAPLYKYAPRTPQEARDYLKLRFFGKDETRNVRTMHLQDNGDGTKSWKLDQ